MARLVLRDTLAVRFSGAELEAAMRRLDAQRRAVTVALWACLLGVLVLELKLPEMLLNDATMAVELFPAVAVHVLSYLAVAWLLSDRIRERFGYGLAIGIGLVQAVLHLLGLVNMLAIGVVPAVESGLLLVLHVALAVTAVRVSLAYPADSRRWPWLAGAGSAVLLIVLVPELAGALWRAASPPPAVVKSPAAPTSALKQAAQALASCAEQYKAAHRAEGYPKDEAAFLAACPAASPVPGAGWSVRYAPVSDSSGATTRFDLQFRQDGTDEMLPGYFSAGPDGEVSRVRLRPAAGRTPESR